MTTQNILGAYLYRQYADDSDLQAFVDSYNEIAQTYLNTFNQIGLPIYPCLTGALLDWVGNGVYGYPRPTVPLSNQTQIGPIATAEIAGYVPIAGGREAGTSTYQVASDDLYIRCLNWHFYKADGQVLNIEWLKRRIARFLYGPGLSAAPFQGWTFDVATLAGISVTFGPEPNVYVQLGNSGPIAQFLAAGMRAGLIQLPYQKSFVVTYG